jgi:methionine-rich copper-binding protein CopC
MHTSDMLISRKVMTVMFLAVSPLAVLAHQTDGSAKPGQNASLQDLKNEIQSLSQKVKVSQTQRFKDSAVVKAGPDGFSIQSSDKQFKLRLGTLLQADDREFVTPSNNGGSPGDGFELRRARVIFDGTVFGIYDFRIEPEFGSRTGGAGGTSSTTMPALTFIPGNNCNFWRVDSKGLSDMNVRSWWPIIFG